jgi:hypothetical protein
MTLRLARTLTAAAMMLATITTAPAPAAAGSISFYGRNGSYAGSAITRNGYTTYTNARGSYAGSSIRRGTPPRSMTATAVMPVPAPARANGETTLIPNELRTDIIAELQFVEMNFRQIAVRLDPPAGEKRPTRAMLEQLSGACEGYANRVARLLARLERPDPPPPIPFTKR